MTIVCSTQQSSLLETTGTAQSTIVLNMGCKGGLLTQIELTRDLRIGTLDEMTAHIDIDEIVPRAPLVGLELLEGKGDLLAIRLLAGVDVTTEIVV